MNAISEIDAQLEADDLVLRIDGTKPLSADAIAAVTAVCNSAEDGAGRDRVIVQVSGTPAAPWAEELTVSLVSKWERALRRLERLPVPTLAVADGGCGGLALDALLATDYRIATGSVRLTVSAAEGTLWPGMALYRLANQSAGTAAIRRAVLFGIPIAAAEALGLHLIDEVSDDVAGSLARITERTGALSGSDLAIRRQMMFDATSTGFEEALGTHLAACDLTLRRAATEAAA
ncbi:enoyl-CoA-hydratase DpgB [Streptomyces paradoxus]|uniref:Isomerase DpgB n=1 Tax=Streptomyces paradoxus TaxID=66375 RepID=A0A7W9TIL4_9ACTN|nr:enoyl-CoA-hydratase DpgB [Streptomyces paradoxus]MBB6081414.1 isomerase DpgB [Streptomyces paradoxus]